MTAEAEPSAVHHQQAELRLGLDVGLTRIDGELALLTQHDRRTAKDLEDLSLRVADLERSRWPVPALTAVMALGTLAAAVWQAVGR